MPQAYSRPEREADPHALPDIEIFYSDGPVFRGECGNDEFAVAAG